VTPAKPILKLKGPKRGDKAPASKRPAVEPLTERTDDEILAELRTIAPDLWNAARPVPLAIGIHKQLYPVAERLQMSRSSLRRFLSRWTGASAYQQALSQPGASRFNLDGSVAGEVSSQHGERAGLLVKEPEQA
jgi:sRNA-binding protein